MKLRASNSQSFQRSIYYCKYIDYDVTRKKEERRTQEEEERERRKAETKGEKSKKNIGEGQTRIAAG